jgi:hypothetical protein
MDKKQSYWWLRFEDIRGQTESTTMAAQDQAICTNNIIKKILKQENESTCWLCKEYEDNIIDHLSSGRPTLAKNEYII